MYPLPRIDECIDSLGDAVVFWTLDCNSGYWQIPLDEADRDKTTFCSHAGSFRFLRMFFGLLNAPATFQRAIDIILSGLKWRTCLVYLDDVIIYPCPLQCHRKRQVARNRASHCRVLRGSYSLTCLGGSPRLKEAGM
jgi:hypothetical protein